MKRATLDNVLLVVDLSDFNPRPREEGDLTAPLGICLLIHFNPRPREEGDTTGFFSVVLAEISIHALVKRATL